MEEKVNDILDRGIVNLIPDKEKLKKLLLSDKKLNVYLGIDPTATKIHVGHAVPLRKLGKLAELGHNAHFLIGDFTALIGDTSDKDKERPKLTTEEINNNFQTYKSQAEKVIDFSNIKTVFNSEWLKSLKFEDIISLCQHFSVGDFVGRELIRKRLSEGKKVGLHETLYPVMQGYDSYHMDTDIQIGSADQTFNMQAGRTLLKDLSDKESFVLVTDYLIGTDGLKMSKTGGNAIWIDDEPNEMFGKVMSLKDDLIVQYFTLATSVSLSKVKEIEDRLEKDNPRDLKFELATQIVTEIYNSQVAHEAGDNFEKTFKNKEPDFNRKVTVTKGSTILDVLDQVVESKSEAKRLLKQNAIQINGESTNNQTYEVLNDDKIKVGKKEFITVKLEK